MKRPAVVLFLALLTLLVAAPSALAAKPTHERMPIDDEFVDESCGFPLQVQQTGFLVAIEWVGEDGSLRRFEAYPQLKATYTNPSTGQSIRVNFSGPAHITEGTDGSFTLVGTGLWLFGSHPDTDEPGIFLLSGRFVLSIDAQGNQSFHRAGRVTDLCAQLAA
jgi:hypothetical protein